MTAAVSVGVDGRTWPVVDGIAFLRTGRQALADAALAATAAGDHRQALALLLTDRDDWAPGPPIGLDEAAAVVDAVDDGCSLREAMAGLGYGPVGDYFAHRWSDPTFLSGLSLLEESWPATAGPAPAHVVELACGIGQLLAAAAEAGAIVTGIDVVFSKLWLARRFVVPGATLVCADVDGPPLPLPDGAADLVFVHDALYFLRDKAAVVAEAQRVGGTLAIGHAHNALVDNWSAGRPLAPSAWADLLPGARCFDDAELTAAWLDRRRPRSRPAADLAGAAAVALVQERPRAVPPRPVGAPRRGRRLRLNPLLDLGTGDPAPLTLRWPSARYREEYALSSAHLRRRSVSRDTLARAERGWTDDPDVADLVRAGIVIDLPERW